MILKYHNTYDKFIIGGDIHGFIFPILTRNYLAMYSVWF